MPKYKFTRGMVVIGNVRQKGDYAHTKPGTQWVVVGNHNLNVLLLKLNVDAFNATENIDSNRLEGFEYERNFVYGAREQDFAFVRYFSESIKDNEEGYQLLKEEKFYE